MARHSSVDKLRGIPGNCIETHQIECDLYVDNECYQKFEKRNIRRLITFIPLTTTIYSCHSLIRHLMFFTGSDVISYGIIVSGFCLLVQLLSLILYCSKLRLIKEKVTKIFVGIFVTLNVANISVDTVISKSQCLQSKIPWILILLYALYCTLQIPRRMCCMTSFLIFCVVIIVNGNNATLSNEYIKETCNSLLQLLAVSVLGICSYTSLQNDLLSFFVKGEKATKTGRKLHQEIDAQRTLMTSVLPTSFADEIYRDFDDVSHKPFRKMYITKHDKVSILFADIVGFTYLSSFCSAVQLVNLLNKIFANFDKTALKYHQVRLKILGDCYYCICGVPNYRADHALLSIKMGLGMIDIIQSISSKVNMRIGIHTGSVLSGVLGLYQWQFDILGKHVTIANKMESSGLPGRIHITESTKACIGTQFELESSNAGEKVAFLKQYNIRTYFVKDRKDTMLFETYFPNNVATDENAPGAVMSHTVLDDNISEDKSWSNSLDTGERTRSKMSRFTLQFESSADERNYRRHCRSRLPLGQICFAFILFTGMSENKSLTDGIHFFIGTVILLSSVLHLNMISRKNLFLDVVETLLLCVSAALAIGLHVTGLANCHILSFPAVNHSDSTVEECRSLYPCICRTLLILIGLNEALFLNYVFKTTILIGLVSVHIVIIFVLRTPVAGISLSSLSYDVTPIFVLDLVGSLLGFLIIICYLERQKDVLKRKLFLWEEETTKQLKNDEDVKHRNEALLYNIFVPQIAEEFLNSRRREDELYSQAYDNVGVMFAACPHFEEFYTENSSFEDGLGSVRFLNEILSDYDQLLSEDRFKELCKIKTIGSTYMVASGLFRHQNDHVDTRRSKRWEHLDTLVNFAVEMKQVLSAINESSFNNFQLRIGISHGPVVAGVIGVKKPHYDIWGNTVNVASRMESTGTVGEIQVLPDTMWILQRYGHTFKPRGVVNVKGKGEMMTYFWTSNT